MKKTILNFKEKKEKNKKISMVTCYDYTSAKLINETSVDAILVGDSLGMVMMGYEDTTKVTMEDMIHHTKCVTNAAPDALVIADMPFLSYEISTQEAVENAGRLIKEASANCVKLEGGAEVSDKIKAIVNAKIPVIAHIGLTPQAINSLGGFKVQGKDEACAKKIIKDALSVQEAGAFAVVLECIPDKLATLITNILDIPTIGIGSGANCSGQVLVFQDILGLNKSFKPKFVKTYVDIGTTIVDAINQYAYDVENVSFPSEEHTFSIEDNIIENLREEYYENN